MSETREQNSANESNFDFDLLEDTEFMDILKSGQLSDVPYYANEDVTATQVLGINTQELLHQASNIKPESHTEVDKTQPVYVVKNPLLASTSNKPATTTRPKTTTRFGDPVSEQQIREKNAVSVPKKTRALNDWSLRVWAQWARHRNAQSVTLFEPGFPIPEDVGIMNDEMLNYWGQRFVMEIKRQDGGDQHPKLCEKSSHHQKQWEEDDH